MKTEIKEVSVLGREISFEVDKEVVEKEKQEIINYLKRNIKTDGFRQGKVPDFIIETKYADDIKSSLLKRIIPHVYIETIKEKGLYSVISPEILDFKFEDGKLFFKVYIELKPEVKIEKYIGLVLKKVEPKPVTNEDIEKVLNNWAKKPEFSASLLDPEKREAWKNKIKSLLESIAKDEAISKEDDQIWEQLLNQTDFPLPEKMVLEKTKIYIAQELQKMDLKNKTKEEIEQIINNMFEKLKPSVAKEIKKYFILDKIGEMENVIVEEKDIEEKILSISKIRGEKYDVVKKKLEETGEIENLKENIRIDKIFKLVKNKANIITKILLPEENKDKIIIPK